MQNAMFVVDRNLQGIKLNQVLDVSQRLKDYQVVTPKHPTGPDRPIVEGQDDMGGLQPNHLYSSAADSALRFYLPHYQISTAPTGQPAVELRYSEKDSGEKGRLTITTTWTPPVTTANLLAKRCKRPDCGGGYQPCQRRSGARKTSGSGQSCQGFA